MYSLNITYKAFLCRFVLMAIPIWILFKLLPVYPQLDRETFLSHISKSISNKEISVQAHYEKLGADYARVVTIQEFVEILRTTLIIQRGDRIIPGLRVADMDWKADNCSIHMVVYQDLSKEGLYFTLSAKEGLRGDLTLHLVDSAPMNRLLNSEKKMKRKKSKKGVRPEWCLWPDPRDGTLIVKFFHSKVFHSKVFHSKVRPVKFVCPSVRKVLQLFHVTTKLHP